LAHVSEEHITLIFRVEAKKSINYHVAESKKTLLAVFVRIKV
jgi:hypothetical protein